MVIPCQFPKDVNDRVILTAPVSQTGSEDVLCSVGPDGDTWTIPTRRNLLKNVPILQELISDGQTTIRLANVDKRGFEQFIRCLECTKIKFTSVSTARTTLDVAYYFQYIPVVEYCVNYLDQHLCAENVLFVYQNLGNYCNNAHTYEPSAPLYNAQALTDTQARIQEICSYLLHNCLIVIDAEAKQILTQELVEELSYSEFLTIVSRNTMQLKHELVVYEAVLRWGRCQCMKLHVPLSPATMREILRELLYKVRYALMSKKEFTQEPANSQILKQEEIELILAVFSRPKTIPTGQWADMNKPRCRPLAQPLFLSLRTKGTQKKTGKPKLEKKEKFILTCLSAWVAIFD
ncbi:axundead [Carabus blaptoides fortunei]